MKNPLAYTYSVTVWDDGQLCWKNAKAEHNPGWFMDSLSIVLIVYVLAIYLRGG